MTTPYKNQTLVHRHELSKERLSLLRAEISKIPELLDQRDLCIYVTGSYGRLEASEYSDLDLFFIHRSPPGSMSQIDQTLVKAALIKLCRKLRYPEFSGDGEYLQVHYIDDVIQYLGSRQDDFENFFTARLLLLLESSPVYNEEVYEEVIAKIIDSYCRDYSGHTAEFRPTFLVNDILRFWKTLCLNYEYPRNSPTLDDNELNKNHLRNLKLKYSRLLTCFSMILPLCVERDTLTPEAIHGLVRQVPLQRVKSVTQDQSEGRKLWHEITANYAVFLSDTGKSREEVLDWIGTADRRELAFAQAGNFGDTFYDLLCQNVDKQTLRYLVI